MVVPAAPCEGIPPEGVSILFLLGELFFSSVLESATRREEGQREGEEGLLLHASVTFMAIQGAA